MTDWLGPAMRDAITIIAILLQAIIALLLYIFQIRMAQSQSEIDALKEANKAHANANDTDLLLLAQKIQNHETTNATDSKSLTESIGRLRDEIANLHVTLPSEYVKQTVLAALQMDIKADMRSVFGKMDEMKDMLIQMGAERRKP